ncbi:recombinase RecT [Ruminococcaceae bacterium OttesenSCG-928-A16]|nr:recombinase RecT [Ruminococcaceae bacterium OttesenSCG-928-A16]
MATANSLQKKQPKFSVAITGEGYKNLINNTLGDPNRAARFTAAITSAVSTNPALQECDAGTILSAGLLGESLNLSPSPQLGQYYLVPFNDNKNGRKVAQFQLGYKGYLQLAMRSGQYKIINVTPVKEGELVKCDPLNEVYEFNVIENDDAREKAETIGYYAVFEYLNGFRKALYWSKSKMQAHAKKFSKGYAAGKGYTFWEKDFDSMAMKTMLRQLISKWGIMSIEMQEALDGDMAVINTDKSKEYVDNSMGADYSELPPDELPIEADEPLPFDEPGVLDD